MRKMILSLALFVMTVAHAQTTVKQKKAYTENGVTKGWEITKELDANGKVISYDSSYFEKPASDAQYHFDGFDGFGSEQFGFNHFYFNQDSISNNGHLFKNEQDFSALDEMRRNMSFMQEQVFQMTDSLLHHFMGPELFEKYMEHFNSIAADAPSKMESQEQEVVIPKKQRKKNKKV